ncbi:MAG: caspase family protein, partial [Deltaproteobacteria bacterium]|nr:caspase family protein [Deltaproteobacteria bacterium]
MNQITTALIALTLIFSMSAAAQEAKETARFAIVIGINASDSTRVADLRYADDDAVATQRMFVQSGIESVLLVSLDEDSERMYPDLVIDGSPTREKLLSEYARLRALMSKAKAVGHRVEFLFVYSGHGSVEHGEGYIVLEKGRLTRTDLYEQILANSPADRNHVIVDACKSYYLAFKKGPGGERKSYTDNFIVKEDSKLFTNTGFLLSTSSNRDSHEWERFQAGVFSHELRSAMRGGADVDGNNLVTYAELGAFLETANEMIANPRYRPDFVVRPPGDRPLEYSQVIIDWTRHKDVLVLDSTVWGNIYIEEENGERLCDLHPAGSEQFSIFLPAERPMFIRKADESEEMVIEGNGIAMYSELVPRSVLVGRKGALHLSFENLFK